MVPSPHRRRAVRKANVLQSLLFSSSLSGLVDKTQPLNGMHIKDTQKSISLLAFHFPSFSSGRNLDALAVAAAVQSFVWRNLLVLGSEEIG